MKNLRIIAFLGLLTACGFHPLYGSHENSAAVAAQLANVHVATIQDSAGQEVRNQILDQLPPPVANPRYQLNVSLLETSTGISIASNTDVTRQQLRNNLHAELVDTQTLETVWRQDLSAISSYTFLTSQYSNLVGAEDARKRNLDDLAARLVNQLSLYFDLPEADRAAIKHSINTKTPNINYALPDLDNSNKR